RGGGVAGRVRARWWRGFGCGGWGRWRSVGVSARGEFGDGAGPEVDLLGMDLESLRTVTHPVLAELVEELRERVAGSGGESLWGHDSSV
ncbi:FXSXX-COOH protein, partial [Streptomyces sp. DvalAA-14]|uniref:FxSxx-COOH cyclophane-containing RiPP peptide n=1 Tax=unclassified Streptomyces TaxID=2593676 RepID=UPI00081B9A49